MVNPHGYSSPKGTAVSFPMTTVDSNTAAALTFTATGPPPGTTISTSGTVTGAGTTTGTYTATVTATDTAGGDRHRHLRVDRDPITRFLTRPASPLRLRGRAP